MYNVYIIKNKCNALCYIGITQLSLEDRFARHLKHSYDINGHRSKLYEAMRELGRHNFYIELLEETDNPQRESHYIIEYNSIQCGYNSVMGDQSISKEDLEELYINRKLSSRQIASILGIKSKTTILSMLKQYDITYRNSRVYTNIPMETLYELYCIDNMSMQKIGELYCVDKSVIKRMLESYNIPIKISPIQSKDSMRTAIDSVEVPNKDNTEQS